MDLRTNVQCAEGREDLRHAIVGKHCNLVNVTELAIGLALEASPYVGHEDLSALHDANGVASALKGVLVSEAVKISGKQVDELGRGAVGCGNEFDNRAIVFL